MAVKHTPGPWYLRDADPENGPVIERIIGSEALQFPLDRVATVPAEQGTDVRDANARLIAAAPDLLKALRYAIECSERDGAKSARVVLNTAGRAAVAKAEGRQP